MPRKKQMLTFIQNGKQLPISKQGFVNLQFLPEPDGITFNLKGGFLDTVPSQFTNAGTKLGHASRSVAANVAEALDDDAAIIGKFEQISRTVGEESDARIEQRREI